jgi:predicted small lipoprotein YifL
MSKKSGVWLIGLVYVSIACGSLTACGTKGPLYIPEQRYPQTKEKASDKASEAPAVNKHALQASIYAASRASSSFTLF